MTAPDAPLPAPTQRDRELARMVSVWDRNPETLREEIAEMLATARREGFRAGIESAAKECEERAALNDAVEGETTGRFPASYHRAIEASECAAAIRALSPDAADHGDGR